MKQKTKMCCPKKITSAIKSLTLSEYRAFTQQKAKEVNKLSVKKVKEI